MFEEGLKGALAKNVRGEGGMVMEEAVEEDQGERELGKLKSYNEEKCFAFIGRCTGGDDVFDHKREFGGIEPYVGQPVSFILENTEKGDTARKIREEESAPEPILSDEGREFGTVKYDAPFFSLSEANCNHPPNDMIELQPGERFWVHRKKEGRR